MPAALFAPLGDLESLGLGKESSFGSFATPTIFHAFTDFAPKPKNILVPRTGARKHWGQARPVTAGFEGDATLDVETDPDTVGQLLAFSMGSQSAPTLNVVAANLSASTIIGATTFNITTTTAMLNDPGYIIPGMQLTFDTAGQQEVLTVATYTPSNSTSTPSVITTTAGAAKTHASAVAVVLTSSTAYLSTLTMGTLPSFSAELNRVTDAVRYLGMYVESVSIAMSAKTGLTTKYTLAYQTEVALAASGTTTPVYSTKSPIIFEHPYNLAMFNGAVVGQTGQVAVQSITLNIANNLLKGYHSLGQGRTVQNIPQQQRKITGSVTMGFETNAAYLAFLGASTGPALITVPAVSLSYSAVGSDMADNSLGVPYNIRFILNNLTLSSHDVANKSTAVITQTFQFEASESSNGADDDIKMIYVGTNSAIF